MVFSDFNAAMRLMQRQRQMNPGNEVAAHLTGLNAAVRLKMGERSFGVVRARRELCIRCLRGDVWITQEARRDDIVLAPGDRCVAKGAQRVFLNSFKGALLSISGAAPGVADAAGFGSGPLDLWLEITQGRYALSGGHPVPRGIMRAGDRRRDKRPIAIAATGTE